ncbi:MULTISPECIES: hypothetical protein [unclassified Caballeronia]|uniref:hypothetical protein n=1 Tax=unclassified Caballeronia TaxID=2646786 RepID=UPI00286648E8|nr:MULTISPECIES: hypothetical protein [unclassified Caballeronia]MDR5777737.1 hypothetical protein [Caballeronia sp. LZ002]MDR5798504.1 hypothetical protein [Caballeronia sp. LZ001]MDR5804979.1 hypothetical protein [Caballeronia sp. LZ001]MDR5853167.1 hypothetical protein [Caballeronia sp. LZ003]
MSHSLERYVEQKLPADLLEHVAANRIRLVVENQGSDRFLPNQIDFSYRKTHRVVNSLRPTWHTHVDDDQHESVILRIPSGYDYIRHFSSLVLHYLKARISSPQDLITIRYDILNDRRYPAMTGLNKLDIARGSQIVIGCCDLLIADMHDKIISFEENDFYMCWKAKNNVVFLGCKFSFWGRLSGSIARSICENFRPAEIIYFGKLGALTVPSDIYDKIFTPSQFHTYSCLTRLGPSITLKNSMAQFNDNGLIGVHASVPTIIEETFQQRQHLAQCGVESIDNEIAFIAREIHRYNVRTCSQVTYSPIHYATDYLRSRSDWSLHVHHDLARGRSPSSLHKKKIIISKITRIMKNYLW